MNIVKNNIYFIKIFLKVFLSIICYLAFTLYTVPAYNNVRAYIDEKMVSSKKYIVVGESSIFVEIADTDEKRIKGLSGRKELARNSGMLFIFPKRDLHGIWMKDMNFSIDIIWFNEFGEIVHIVENATPESYPKTFTPPKKSQYVLEVRAGFVKREGLKLGDKVDLL
jgi:uncharacterized protein